ncbi:putative ATP-grasp-modified RiPP [Nocardiopsis dassonvillei]
MPLIVSHDVVPTEDRAYRPFGLTRCTVPEPESAYDVSGIGYDPVSQMSVRDGRPLIDQPLLGTAVQCTVTTTEDMQAWSDQVTDS